MWFVHSRKFFRVFFFFLGGGEGEGLVAPLLLRSGQWSTRQKRWRVSYLNRTQFDVECRWWMNSKAVRLPTIYLHEMASYRHAERGSHVINSRIVLKKKKKKRKKKKRSIRIFPRFLRDSWKAPSLRNSFGGIFWGFHLIIYLFFFQDTLIVEILWDSIRNLFKFFQNYFYLILLNPLRSTNYLQILRYSLNVGANLWPLTGGRFI